MSSASASSEGLSVLVVDDEELACRNLARKLLAAGGVREVATETDPVLAVARLREQPPDLLLLDVRMPGLDGFELLAHFPEAERRFAVVFCTAHDEHAGAAFDAAALDYLVKPVDPARLGAALARVRRLRPAPDPAAGDLARARAAGITGWLERVLVRFQSRVEVLDLAKVELLSSEAHRTVAYTATAEHVLEPSLAAIEPQLEPGRFVRCHRAHLVQVQRIAAVEGDEVVLRGGRRVPLSRRCRTAVVEALEAAGRPRR